MRRLVLLLLAVAACAATAASDSRRRGLVRVDLYVMARCPDAQRAEARFDDVLARVADLVDLRTVYIADATGPQTVCKHGAQECAGDIQQLCAQRYRPQGASPPPILAAPHHPYPQPPPPPPPTLTPHPPCPADSFKIQKVFGNLHEQFATSCILRIPFPI